MVWGDEWESRIKRVITKDCKLFLPLISSHTQARSEGVFRREWTWAVERDEGIQGKRFILPLIIDEQTAAVKGDGLLVPERFLAKHFEYAISGEIPESLRQLLVEEIRNIRREGGA